MVKQSQLDILDHLFIHSGNQDGQDQDDTDKDLFGVRVNAQKTENKDQEGHDERCDHRSEHFTFTTAGGYTAENGCGDSCHLITGSHGGGNTAAHTSDKEDGTDTGHEAHQHKASHFYAEYADTGIGSTGRIVTYDVNLTSETAKTAGQKLYLQYGITGVRGEAEAGFPAVLNVGLPKLEAALAAGKTINEAGCAALLAMLASTVDTNMIHRGGYVLAKETSQKLKALLEKEPFPSKETLEALDAEFLAKNLSPGGTADLLALTYLLHFLKEEPHE